ncbi:Nucleoporin nup49/NSP49 (Nuclear pore protein nup49/NSP49) [Fusarium falciforme]|nr:Nucleoporin nup49/NSP49 (Nuclear pore protein nup49/NSP49) [Fusarium falciforme]
MSLTRSASGPAGGLTINTGAANAFGATASKPSAAGTLFGSAANTPNNTTTAPAGASTMSTAGKSLWRRRAKDGDGSFRRSGKHYSFNWWRPVWKHSSSDSCACNGRSLWDCPCDDHDHNRRPAAPATGTTSLFGGQKPAGSGLFGGAAPAQQTTTAQNTSTFGQPAAQVSAVQINYDNIRHRTCFDDLAKPVQDEIALLDKGIQRVIKMRDEIGEFMPQHEKDIEQLGRDVSFVEFKFRIVDAALNNDVNTVKNLHDQTRKNAADARLCFRGADNLKLPAHYHQTGLFASQAPTANSNGGDAASTHADAQDLITYFNRICDDIEKSKARLDEYRGSIERDMPGVENGLYEQIRSLRDRSTTSIVVQDKLNEVLLALRDTGNAIIYQAGQIADTRERLSRLQAGIVDSGVYGLSMNA